MNHNSFLPTNYKKGLIDICYSDLITYVLIIILYITKLEKNCVPLFFVDNCIKNVLQKVFITRKTSNTISDKKSIFVCLEFLDKIYL